MAAIEDTLVAGDTTIAWMAGGTGAFTLTLGGTFNTTTASLTASNSENGTYRQLYVDDATGTVTAQQFTSTHVASSSNVYSRLYVLPGMWFKLTTNSTGTTPAITVAVSGAGVLTPAET